MISPKNLVIESRKRREPTNENQKLFQAESRTFLLSNYAALHCGLPDGSPRAVSNNQLSVHSRAGTPVLRICRIHRLLVRAAVRRRGV